MAQDVSRAHNNEKRFLPRAQMMLTRIMVTLMALSQRVSIIVTGLQILKINTKKNEGTTMEIILDYSSI